MSKKSKAERMERAKAGRCGTWDEPLVPRKRDYPYSAQMAMQLALACAVHGEDPARITAAWKEYTAFAARAFGEAGGSSVAFRVAHMMDKLYAEYGVFYKMQFTGAFLVGMFRHKKARGQCSNLSMIALELLRWLAPQTPVWLAVELGHDPHVFVRFSDGGKTYDLEATCASGNSSFVAPTSPSWQEDGKTRLELRDGDIDALWFTEWGRNFFSYGTREISRGEFADKDVERAHRRMLRFAHVAAGFDLERNAHPFIRIMGLFAQAMLAPTDDAAFDHVFDAIAVLDDVTARPLVVATTIEYLGYLMFLVHFKRGAAFEGRMEYLRAVVYLRKGGRTAPFTLKRTDGGTWSKSNGIRTAVIEEVRRDMEAEEAKLEQQQTTLSKAVDDDIDNA